MKKAILTLLAVICVWALCGITVSVHAREKYSLNAGWHTVCYPEGQADSLENWKVELPHNWDDYYGYRQYTHGNLHGTARYERKFSLFDIDRQIDDKQVDGQLFILHFEGAGSYLTVLLNGKEICRHRPAGRVVTSLDVTSALYTSDTRKKNELVVICEHPSNITDMPWVCGGCSSEWGFSEGSAPLGLFRDVTLETSHPLRVEPFGVHAWANDQLDTVWVETELRNYSSHGENCVVQNVLEGKLKKEVVQIGARQTKIVRQALAVGELNLKHWDVGEPHLYQVVTTLLHGAQHDEVTDRISTEVGFSVVKWPRRTLDGKLSDTDHRLYVNGKPVFVHGVCEYEHLFGQSHALSSEEIDYRCDLITHMGFNAVRDAHQPHNLRYGDNWARQGVLWWPQFSAHIWYDTPQFRHNFKMLLRQWIKERRNNPAVVLWGLQNESTLPEDFARECCDIIREMDPKCSQIVSGSKSKVQDQPNQKNRKVRTRKRPRHRISIRQHLSRSASLAVANGAGERLNDGRLITTCNGGTGSDWNVIQNWSGTYGGKLEAYGSELAQDDQLLNGEYGGWRTVGLHDQQSMQRLEDFDTKASWSEDHFCTLMHAKLAQAWLSREQVCGQFQWILASHDNPGRQQPDEFLRVIDKIGPLNYKGLLTAMWEPTMAYYLYVAWGAYMRGNWRAELADAPSLTAREMVKEGYRLEGVPMPDYLLDDNVEGCCDRPDLHSFVEKTASLAPDRDRVYLYRYNCGGDEEVDSYGNVWMGDDTRFCYNWSMAPQFAADSLCPVLASQSLVDGWVLEDTNAKNELLAARNDQSLLRSYRYGRHELQFGFPLPAGQIYKVDLWFVNRKHVVKHVSYLTRSVVGGQLIIGFPGTKQGQSKVSAIAISVDKKQAKELGKIGDRGRFEFKDGLLDPEHPVLAQAMGYPYGDGLTWADLDRMVIEKTDKATLPADKGGRPSAKFMAEEGQPAGTAVFAIQMGLAQEYALRFRYKNPDGPLVKSRWQLLAQQDGRVVAEGDLTLPQTPNKMKMVSTTTGTFVNAGHYRLVIKGAGSAEFESVEVQ